MNKELEINEYIPHFSELYPKEITLKMTGKKAPCSICVYQGKCHGSDCEIYQEWLRKVYRKEK